ncbi:AAEL007406-PA [Aedes aegypti]|uniref:Elongator complex protein 5 n=1 Tax=Aedes aegypti TaxID=7159 RepID=Q172E5_AEDAE|nr:AAEL007406-PA [Aedes aegypti]
MLSNYLLNQQKILLIKDHLGIESTALKVVTKWLCDGKGPEAAPEPVESLTEQGPYLVARISKLARTKTPRELFQFVQRCKQNGSVQYLFLWATEKNISAKFLVPFLEHQSELIVTLEDERHLTIVVKKSGGSISNKRYQYQLQEGCFSVKELKKTDQSKGISTSLDSSVASIDPASLGSFKIGDLKKEEQEAKEALTLPFEFFKATPEGGRVLYHPDAEDDLDEEDPDDDLLI